MTTTDIDDIDGTGGFAQVAARRPGPRAWRMLVLSEARMVARDTAGLIVPLGLPLLILVMSASAASRQAVGTRGLTGLEAYVLPLVLAVVFASIGIVNMPSFLAYYRRTGILRRLGVTPASPVMVLAAQVLVSLGQALLGTGLALAVAVLGFGARLPDDPWTVLGIGLLGIAAMYAVGLVVAAVAPTPNSAVAIGLVAFLAIGAVGGLFGSPDALPDPVATVGGHLPFGATVQTLGAAWVGADVEPSQLLALVVSVVVGTALSTVLFRWD